MPQIDYTTFLNQVVFFMIVFLILIFYLFHYELAFLRNKYTGKDFYFSNTLDKMGLTLGFKQHSNINSLDYNPLVFFVKKPVFSKFFYLVF